MSSVLVYASPPSDSSMRSDACYRHQARVGRLLHDIGYNRRQETKALMKDYGGISPLILLYLYYFSMSLVLPVSVITASS